MFKKLTCGILLIILLSINISCFATEQQNINKPDPDNDRLIFCYNYILKNSNVNANTANYIARAILYGCGKYQVNPLLILAIFQQESGFEPTSESPVGAIGIAQIMPETAYGIGINPNDVGQNIIGGIYYISQQLQKFSNCGEWSTSYAVAAYNAGPGAVQEYGGIPPYDETIKYVRSVGAIYNRLLKIAPQGLF
ncbi:MAG: lytic transglycosylase domain-containing protein [Patescibacteria group bacterium]|jgi:soluble lytic murein transglycosylase-like protein